MDGAAIGADLGRFFCTLPFSYAEIHPNGKVYLCCPRYSGLRAVGNIFRDSPSAVWNSYRARQIRAGIHDGSYRLCDHKECPNLAGRSLPLRARVEADPVLGPILREGTVELATGPETVKLCHDESCNLSCPSCRKEAMVAGKERQARLDRMVHDFILPFLADTRLLILSGDGDPFASKHYRDVLKATAAEHPRLRIGLHTNGVLCDDRAWDELRLAGRVDTVEVSVDAADPLTYGIVRRGGDFARLKRNLAALGRRRQAGEFRELELSFVVQAANFREMPAFVALGQEIGADRIRFALIRHWRRGLSYSEFPAARVWSRRHPQFAAFLDVLRDPILAERIVWPGDLAPFMAEAKGQAPASALEHAGMMRRVRFWVGG
ncbi:MAG: radical SAM protein [Rhodospirillaceae bacterium]|nr:radical SAM protein [Rhodospirillaceae bacterium]